MKFADTIHSVERADHRKGVALINEWEKQLGSIDTPGAKGILRNLEALRKRWEKDEPNAERVDKLLCDLGEATTKIADRADKSGDKLQDLGSALTKAGK